MIGVDMEVENLETMRRESERENTTITSDRRDDNRRPSHRRLTLALTIDDDDGHSTTLSVRLQTHTPCMR